MIILGYLFTALNYICYCLGRFMKKKTSILAMSLLAKIFLSFGLYCIGSLSGAYIHAISFGTLIVVNLKENLQKQWVLGYVFFQVLYLFVLFKTFIGISSILVTITATITLVSNWFLPPQKMRISATFNSLLNMLYHITIKNWAGLLEIFALFSNVTAYLKYRKKNIK